jgi:hypothetical protein
VPHYWIRIPGNPKPPNELRNQTRHVVHRHGGTVVEDEVFFESPTLGYALINVDVGEIEEIANELNTEAPPPLYPAAEIEEELAEGD